MGGVSSLPTEQVLTHPKDMSNSPVIDGVDGLITSRSGRNVDSVRLLFVCTGNACRSAMAEGIARHYGMDRVEVFSVGVAPAMLDHKAVRVMAEMGIDIAGHTPKGVEAVSIGDMDLVVTLCDYAQGLFPGGYPTQHRLHWSIKDPHRLWGPDWLVLGAYRTVRDDLAQRIRNLLLTFPRKPSTSQF